VVLSREGRKLFQRGGRREDAGSAGKQHAGSLLRLPPSGRRENEGVN